MRPLFQGLVVFGLGTLVLLLVSFRHYARQRSASQTTWEDADAAAGHNDAAVTSETTWEHKAVVFCSESVGGYGCYVLIYLFVAGLLVAYGSLLRWIRRRQMR